MADCREGPFRARKRLMRIFLLLLTAMLARQSLHSQDLLPYVEAGVGRKQGDFGTPVRSTLGLAYTTLGVSSARWDANLSIPYLRLAREGEGISSQEKGFGDIVARGIYRFLPETENGWSLDGLGAIKLPTASETKGLGTGRTDLGVFIALNQQLGLLRWTILSGRIQGDSSKVPGSSEVPTAGAFVLGLNGSLSFEGTRWGLSLEARGPAYQGVAGAKEFSADVFHPLSPKWGLKAVVTVGLSDGGPRQSFGLGVICVFP